MNKNEKGFSIVEVLIILLVAGLIGTIGWLVLDRQKNAAVVKATQENSKKQNVDEATEPYENWQAASFELIDVSFKYPKTLKLTHELHPEASPNSAFESFALEASDKTRIYLGAFIFQGGFTGFEPEHLIEDVISGKDSVNNREFSSIIYKNNDGQYDAAYITDTSETKYKAGEKSQIFLNAFPVRSKVSNGERSWLAISVRGQQNQTFKSLNDIKSMGAFKDIQQFINSLNAPKEE